MLILLILRFKPFKSNVILSIIKASLLELPSAVI
jgi:hypothetical protein